MPPAEQTPSPGATSPLVRRLVHGKDRERCGLDHDGSDLVLHEQHQIVERVSVQADLSHVERLPRNLELRPGGRR